MSVKKPRQFEHLKSQPASEAQRVRADDERNQKAGSAIVRIESLTPSARPTEARFNPSTEHQRAAELKERFRLQRPAEPKPYGLWSIDARRFGLLELEPRFFRNKVLNNLSIG